ncbi:MAG: apt [Acidimicrobiales bacterium]|nr:apt [Acidimicrobiales bacterium]
MGDADFAWLADHVRDVADFPQPGVAFKDITPLLGHADALRAAIDGLAAAAGDGGVDHVVGVEARGFILGAAVAYRLGCGFVPVRKLGKLPWSTEQETYALEYGTDVLEMHVDALLPGSSVLIVDDVIATGGTAAATARLVEKLGATVTGFAFLIELTFLAGREEIAAYPITSLVAY